MQYYRFVMVIFCLFRVEGSLLFKLFVLRYLKVKFSCFRSMLNEGETDWLLFYSLFWSTFNLMLLPNLSRAAELVIT